MFKRTMVAVILIAVTGVSSAVDGKESRARKGGYCVCNGFTGANSVFKCEHLGEVTIREIYEKGWRIVLKQDVPGVSAAMGLIIEEQ